MSKVYVVTEGCYSSYSIRAIFDRKDWAEALASRLSSDAMVEEYELGTLKATLPTWIVMFYDDGSVEADMNCYANPNDEPCMIGKESDTYEHGLRINVRAEDKQHAKRIATDRRTEYLAEQAGI